MGGRAPSESKNERVEESKMPHSSPAGVSGRPVLSEKLGRQARTQTITAAAARRDTATTCAHGGHGGLTSTGPGRP